MDEKLKETEEIRKDSEDTEVKEETAPEEKPEEASEEMAEKLGCKLYMYETLGHAAYEEAKDFNKIVYDFLKE